MFPFSPIHILPIKKINGFKMLLVLLTTFTAFFIRNGEKSLRKTDTMNVIKYSSVVENLGFGFAFKF